MIRFESFKPVHLCYGLTRRHFLHAGSLSMLGLSLPQFDALQAAQAAPPDKERNGMMIFLLGGPSQLDTWDPKPGTATGGDARAIATSVPGIQVAHHFPRVARVMDDVALIRSMTNKEGNHQRASYQLHTGYAPSGTVKHPSFGCVVGADQVPHLYGSLAGRRGAELHRPLHRGCGGGRRWRWQVDR